MITRIKIERNGVEDLFKTKEVVAIRKLMPDYDRIEVSLFDGQRFFYAHEGDTIVIDNDKVTIERG